MDKFAKIHAEKKESLRRKRGYRSKGGGLHPCSDFSIIPQLVKKEKIEHRVCFVTISMLYSQLIYKSSRHIS